MKKNNKQISIKKAKRHKKNVKRIKGKELKEHYMAKYLRRQQMINKLTNEEENQRLLKPVIDGLSLGGDK